MKIVIDARMNSWPGIGRYSRNLLEQLQKLDERNEYLVLLRSADFKTWQPSNERFTGVAADFEPYSLAEQLQLPRLIRRLKPDLVHFTGQNFPILYRGPYVVTIHDLTQLRFQNRRGGRVAAIKSRLKQLAFRLVLWRAAHGAKHIITISQFVKQDLARELAIPPEQITATLLAGDNLPAKPGAIDRFKLNHEFLLYVGSIYPHKNLTALVEALPQIQAQHPGLKLVLAGKGAGDDYFRQQLRSRIAELGLADSVVMTGKVTDTELAGLYRQAKLFVFPSLSEGFGIPLLEAMDAGTPVASSDSSSLPEVGGNAAAYFDATDADKIAAVVNRLLKDKTGLARLRQAGFKQIKRFSWVRTAAETMAVYESLGVTSS